MNKKSIRIIEKFLRRKLDYRFDEGQGVFRMHVSPGAKAGLMGVALIVREDVVNCLATFPFRGTDETAVKLSEFVCRINVNLSVGHLDYDFNGGEVRVAYDISSGQLRAEKGDALDEFFSGLCLLGEKLGPCIARLALGCGDPAEMHKSVMSQFGGENPQCAKSDDGVSGEEHTDSGVAVVPAGQKQKPVVTPELGKRDGECETKNEEDEKPPVPVKN